jgi:hypothetical protein
MHRIACHFGLPTQQLINKWHDDKAATKTKQHRSHASGKTSQHNQENIVQGTSHL